MQKEKIYVINAKNSTSAVLQDVMENKANYKDRIITFVNEEAFKNKIELMGGNGITKISDTQSFYIKDNKLHIYFEASEIAPVSAGALDFELPFTLTKQGLFNY